jgi:rubrerythrin
MTGLFSGILEQNPNDAREEFSMPDQAKAFAASQTRENLMRAFAGESQARSRYTIAAGIAHKSGLAVIQGLFLFTAEQEKTHAKQFYRQLHDLSGQTVRVDGTYPVDLYTDLLDYLRAAQHNEYQEWEHDYAAFARTAMEEGFPLVGKLFENIAGVEKLHGDRFGRYADLLEQEQLFVSDVKEAWMCLHCGYVVDATVAPANCPVCRHPQGYFIRAELTPFRGGSIR